MQTTITLADAIHIGNEFPIFIIAEAGVNHNGNVGLALQLVEQAKRAGADCVKFQTFTAERIVTSSAPKARYQLSTTDERESQFTMLKNLELSFDEYTLIVEKCAEENILFLSTPYSEEDVDFLETLRVPAYKIASGQIVELPFLRRVARTQKPIFLSTGMSTTGEIDLALRAIRDEGNDNIVLLQCTTNYPSRISDANLRVIPALRESFNVHLGYSDHTQTGTACIVSVAYGVRVIEKHFTLDKSLPGPDHSSSADVREFTRLVADIRDAERSLGISVKQPADDEKNNSIGMRRSICARSPIAEGTVITAEMLTFKRPATGILPSYFDLVVGKKARRAISCDALMTWEDLW